MSLAVVPQRLEGLAVLAMLDEPAGSICQWVFGAEEGQGGLYLRVVHEREASQEYDGWNQ